MMNEQAFIQCSNKHIFAQYSNNIYLHNISNKHIHLIVKYLMKRSHRLLSQRTPQLKSSHIVEDHLNRKSQLIDKYQTETQELLSKMEDRPRMGQMEDRPRKKTLQTERQIERQSLQKSRNSSQRRQNSHPYDNNVSYGPMKDFQKLILGLEYALESERKKTQHLEHQNMSLETQISNLRNLLVGPDQQKHYQKTVFKENQDKIQSLENKLLDQKKHYQFIIDSKNQALASLEIQLRVLEKNFKDENKESGLTKKMLELMGSIEELRNSITKKNILIERLKYMKQKDGDSDDEQINKIRKVEKLNFYSQQLELSNKLILKKNIQILNLSNKTLKYEDVLDVIEQYLDKKQVKNVDISVLEHPCITKLRILLREKAVFERELLNQLNQHNKKISTFQNQILDRQVNSGNRIIQAVNDNKRLAALVHNLQNNIKNLQSKNQDQKGQNQILKNQIEINKKQFLDQMRRMKDEINTISSVTKNQFDRLKIENLKLTEQNRSLLFLVGEKEKEIHKKGEAIKTFVDYKDKINNLDLGQKERRKIDNTSEDIPQIGTKLLLINTFSSWMMEWNKTRNWSNKKVLLNLILDKEQIKADSLNSMTYLINVLHECFLSSKNVDVQERAIILLAYYIPQKIVKNSNLFIGKISPIILRGFRQRIEGQDDDRHRILNESTLKIIKSLSNESFRWSEEMTNEMIGVNGLRYLFEIITKSQVDELVDAAYSILILIGKQNEMISFMNTFNVTTILLKNLHSEYPFLLYLLHYMKILLESTDYIRSQKSLLEFRKIYELLKDEDDEEVIDIALDCCLTLMQNSLFTKSLNKIEVISILSQLIRNVSEFKILKKIGTVYIQILQQLQTENISKYARNEIDKMLQIISSKKFNENRFNRALRIILRVSQIINDSPDLDEKIFIKSIALYESYSSIQVETRMKLNSIISTIYDRNKDIVNKYSNEEFICNLIEAYKSTATNEEIVFLLKIMLFQHEQKRTTEILRNGREALINKLIHDTSCMDYNVAIAALKNLLAIAKEKYADKFVNSEMMTKIIHKVLSTRNQEEFIGVVLSIIYFLSKNEDLSTVILDCGLVPKLFQVITEKHDKEAIIFKCLSILEHCNTTNYKKKILNYLLSHDSNLAILKTINFVLKKAKNKNQMGARAVFIYDFLNGKGAIDSIILLVEENTWMVEDMISVRNEYIQKVDALVYKIELLLHSMSTKSIKVKKVYQKYKVAGDESEDQS